MVRLCRAGNIGFVCLRHCVRGVHVVRYRFGVFDHRVDHVGADRVEFLETDFSGNREVVEQRGTNNE